MKHYRSIVCAVVLFCLMGISNNARADVNWNIYKSNSFLWGQIFGCFARFEIYAQETANELFKKEQIDAMLKQIIGDITQHKNNLIAKGMGPNHLGKMSIEEYETMIHQIGVKELQNNMSWMQTLTCVKTLKDHKFIE